MCMKWLYHNPQQGGFHVILEYYWGWIICYSRGQKPSAGRASILQFTSLLFLNREYTCLCWKWAVFTFKCKWIYLLIKSYNAIINYVYIYLLLLYYKFDHGNFNTKKKPLSLLSCVISQIDLCGVVWLSNDEPCLLLQILKNLLTALTHYI